MDKKQKFAKRLLGHRRNGLSFPGSTARNVFLIAFNTILAVWIILRVESPLGMICAWALGMFIGAIVVNLIWQRMVKSKWPLLCEFIDWHRAEALGGEDAEEEAPDTP